MNWDELFKRQPKRYIRYINKKTGKLFRVEDRDTGYVWIKTNDKWMAIG